MASIDDLASCNKKHGHGSYQICQPVSVCIKHCCFLFSYRQKIEQVPEQTYKHHFTIQLFILIFGSSDVSSASTMQCPSSSYPCTASARWMLTRSQVAMLGRTTRDNTPSARRCRVAASWKEGPRSCAWRMAALCGSPAPRLCGRRRRASAALATRETCPARMVVLVSGAVVRPRGCRIRLRLLLCRAR